MRKYVYIIYIISGDFNMTFSTTLSLYHHSRLCSVLCSTILHSHCYSEQLPTSLNCHYLQSITSQQTLPLRTSVHSTLNSQQELQHKYNTHNQFVCIYVSHQADAAGSVAYVFGGYKSPGRRSVFVVSVLG